MFGTHIVMGDTDEIGHGFEAGTRVQLMEDDGTTRKCWVDKSGKSYWVSDEDLEPVDDPA